MSKRKYSRDGRAPIPLSEKTSKVMSANKSKNTKPEILFRKELRKNGVIGYRLNWKKAPGRPDICFPGKKLAIFIHGCFWHRCPICDLPLPRSNTAFWKEKFQKNVKRDRAKVDSLKAIGWKVVTLWECEIKKNIQKQVNKVIKLKKKSV
ncbi:MAG: very short patch repair endonuclease [Bacteroidia bacterium]